MITIRSLMLMAGLLSAPLAAVAEPAEPTVEWSILNRFRAFDYTAHDSPRDAARLFARYQRQEGEIPERWIERIAVHGSPYADAPSGWEEAADGAQYGYHSSFVQLPRTLRIRARLRTPGGPLDGSCRWVAGAATLATAPCHDAVEFDVASGAHDLSVVQPDGRSVPAVFQPRLTVILGLGDSYAAGEGNPDRPTVWHTSRIEPGFDGQPRLGFDAWPMGDSRALGAWIRQAPVWQSPRCHRSFWSYQNLAALQVASAQPHAVVAFVHLACSGAEIVDGLLLPQRHPPGRPSGCNHASSTLGSAPDPVCDVPISQLRAAVGLLCRSTPAVPVRAAATRVLEPLSDPSLDVPVESVASELRVCPLADRIAPDALLLSIGGNDVGFGGVVAWALAPVSSRYRMLALPQVIIDFGRREAGVVCPRSASYNGGQPCGSRGAWERIPELKPKYRALAAALTDLLGIAPGRVVLNSYPNPLRDGNGARCGDVPRTTMDNAWSGLRAPVYTGLFPDRWQFNLTAWEAGEVEKWVVGPLQRAVPEAASAHGWRLARNAATMDRTGWCVGPPSRVARPSDTAAWRPYTAMGRTIRTASDAFLTQWIGPGHAGGIGGTFHPNLQGHAAFATAALEELAHTMPR